VSIKKSNGPLYTVSVAFFTTPEVVEEVRCAAFRKKVTRSEFFREAVREKLEREST